MGLWLRFFRFQLVLSISTCSYEYMEFVEGRRKDQQLLSPGLLFLWICGQFTAILAILGLAMDPEMIRSNGVGGEFDLADGLEILN